MIGGRRGLRARPGAVREGDRSPDRRRRRSRRRRRAARRRARRVRARGAGGPLGRARTREGRRLRPAREHRGRPLDLALPRRARRRRVGRLPHVRAARPDHAGLGVPVRRTPARRSRSRAGSRTRFRPMREWLASAPVEGLSRHAKLREIETHVVGPMCHVMYAYTTGDAVGLNMITRNSYALNMGFVRERAPVKPRRSMLEGNMGGDKKISHRYFERGGHGKTVLAECTLTDEAVRRVLKTTVDDLLELAFVGTHGASLRACSRSRSRPRPRSRRSSSPPARTSAWSGRARWRTGRPTASRAGCTHRSACPGSRSRRSAAGRPSRTRAPGSASWAATGAGKVYRFAQIVAAATLALEISASAAMATAGSENFFRAHFERGGLR